MTWKRVRVIFEQLYDDVFYLVDWLNQFRKEKKFPTDLLLESDSQSYRKLLRTTVVGVASAARPLPVDVTFSQDSHQQEIIRRVIEKLYMRKGAGRNVLTLGFGLLSDNPNVHTWSGASIESYYPNNNVSCLQDNAWNTLLSRIGDVIMMYLLENTAIFMLLPSSCYIQVAGVPVYELCPLKNSKIVKPSDYKHSENKINRKRHQRYWQKFSKTGNQSKKRKLNCDSAGPVKSKPKEHISRSDICSNTVNASVSNSSLKDGSHKSSDGSVNQHSGRKYGIKFTRVQRSDVFSSNPQWKSVLDVSEKLETSDQDVVNPCHADSCSSQFGQIPEVNILDRKSNKVLDPGLLNNKDRNEVIAKSKKVIPTGESGLKRKLAYETEDVGSPKVKCMKLDACVEVKDSSTKYENTKLDSMERESYNVPNQDISSLWNKNASSKQVQYQEIPQICIESRHEKTDYGQHISASRNVVASDDQSQEVSQRECKENSSAINTESQSTSELPSSEFSQCEAVPIGHLEQNSQTVEFVPLHTDSQYEAVPIGHLEQNSQTVNFVPLHTDSKLPSSELSQCEVVPIGHLQQNSQTVEFVPLHTDSKLPSSEFSQCEPVPIGHLEQNSHTVEFVPLHTDSKLPSSEFSQCEAVPIGHLQQNSQTVEFVPLHTDSKQPSSEFSQCEAVPIGHLQQNSHSVEFVPLHTDSKQPSSEFSQCEAVPIGHLQQNSHTVEFVPLHTDSKLPSSEFSQYEVVPIGHVEQNSQTVQFVPLHTETLTRKGFVEYVRVETEQNKISEYLRDKSCAGDCSSVGSLGSSSKSVLPVGNIEVRAAQNGTGHPEKKRCRRKRKKPQKDHETKDYKPYDFHKCFPRLNLLCNRNLREGCNKSFCLNQLDSSQLFDAVFQKSTTAIPSDSTILVKDSTTYRNSNPITRTTANTVTDSRVVVNGVNDKRAQNTVCHKIHVKSDLNTFKTKRYHIMEKPLDPAGDVSWNKAILNPSVTNGKSQIQDVISSHKLSSKTDYDKILTTTCYSVDNKSSQIVSSTSKDISSFVGPQKISSTVCGDTDTMCSSQATRNKKCDVVYSEVFEEKSCLHASNTPSSCGIRLENASHSPDCYLKHSSILSSEGSVSCKSQSGSGSLFSMSPSQPNISSSIPSSGKSSDSSESLGSSSYSIIEYTSTSQERQQDSSSLDNRSFGDDRASCCHHAGAGSSVSSSNNLVSLCTNDFMAAEKQTDKSKEQMKNSSVVDSLKDNQHHILPTLSSEHISGAKIHHSTPIITDKSTECGKMSGRGHSIFFDSKNSKEKLLGVINLSGLDPVTKITDKEPCIQMKDCGEMNNRQSTSFTNCGFHANVLPLLKQMLANHRKCAYSQLLNHYCPLANLKKKKKSCSRSVKNKMSDTAPCNSLNTVNLRCPNLSAPVVTRGQNVTTNNKGRFATLKLLQLKKNSRKKKQKISTGKLLEAFSTTLQVFGFLRAVVLRVIPLELLGSKTNRNIFLKNLKTFVSGGKFDKFRLGQVMSGVKVKRCKWLRSEVGHSGKVCKMAQMVWWLFNDFIMEVMKGSFYVTETAPYRNRLFYYRKPLWHHLNTRAVQNLTHNKMLQTVSETRVTELLKTGTSLGVSYLRFLPKSGSLRPIMNLGRRPIYGTKKTLSINQKLVNLLHVLKFHVKNDPNIVGSSLFGLDDTYRAWVKFAAHRHLINDDRLLYFVKTDITGCYDTIRQEKLYSIVGEILKKNTSDSYVTRIYASMVASGGRLKRLFHRDSYTLITYQPDFFVFTKKRIAANNLRNMILVDQVVNQHDTVSSLMNTLHAHLFNNIIKVGRRYYSQNIGITQGSVLSTMLCNLYYGHMERQTVDVKEDELLMRMVDDFLFVTPYKDRAEKFLDDMLKGNEEYNCKTNVSKVLTNFPVEGSQDGDIPHVSRTEPLPWCGLLINTNTLEVSVDYSRYSGLRISDTMTFDLACKPGLAMKNKLLQSLRPKCHGIFFDPQINSEPVVIVNVYKMMLLSAYKFHTYVMHLPPLRRSSNNVRFFHDAILTLSSHLHSKAAVQMGGKQIGRIRKVFPLTLDVVKWLTLEAFLSKLKQHHSVYSTLILSLQDLKRGINKKLVDSRSILVQTEAAPLSVQHSDLITSGPQERHQQETKTHQEMHSAPADVW